MVSGEYGIKHQKTPPIRSATPSEDGFPFACMVFALLGTPLALQSQRRTSSAGLGITLLNVIFYYVLMAVGTFLGQSGLTSPWVGAWLQNLLIGGYGLYLFIRKAFNI